MDSLGSSLQPQGRVESLYSTIHMISIKSGYKDERQRELRVTVELHSAVGPMGRQVLGIHITDDEDCFFLQSLLLTGDDFKSLKAEQGLRVDFDQFPLQLCRLLKGCAVSRADLTQAKYHLLLTDDSVLQIVETNDFKHLCHLALKTCPGSDSEIKKHMALKIKELQTDLSRVTSLLESKSSQLLAAQDQLAGRQLEAEAERAKEAERRAALETRLAQEAAESREALRKAHEEFQLREQALRQEAEETRRRDTWPLQQEVADLKVENQRIKEELLSSQAKAREFATHGDIKSRQLAECHQELKSLREHLARLEADNNTQNQTILGLKMQLGHLEGAWQNKEQLSKKQQELLQKANDERLQLKETVMANNSRLKELHDNCARLADDLAHSNEQVAKLVADKQKLMNERGELQAVQAHQQEQMASQVRELEQQSTLLREVQARLAEEEERHRATREQLERAKHDIELKEKALVAKDLQLQYRSQKALPLDVRRVLDEAPRPGMTFSNYSPIMSTPHPRPSQQPSSLNRVPLTTLPPQNPETDPVMFNEKFLENIRNNPSRLGYSGPGPARPPLSSHQTPLEWEPQKLTNQQTSASDSPAPQARSAGASNATRGPGGPHPQPRPRPQPTDTTPSVNRKAGIYAAYNFQS